jgi:hypothetical protein
MAQRIAPNDRNSKYAIRRITMHPNAASFGARKIRPAPLITLSRELAKDAKIGQTTRNSIVHQPEVKLTHASMLKARRKHQKTRKLLEGAEKAAKRLLKQSLKAPVVKKEKVKKEKVKKEKIKTEKVKKVKLTKEELSRQDAKNKASAVAGKKGAPKP